MLRDKRPGFEGEFNVPENERLPGEGWVASFCKIKEYRRHGEAGSADMAEVEAERVRV
jgi:hypothetical protein